MKKSVITLFAVVGLAAGLAFSAQAAEEAKEVTIKGMGMCLKCELKKAEECQNAIQVEKDGKKLTYALVDAEGKTISKDFHGKNLCQSTKKVVAKGVVKEKEDGKLELVVAAIELDKES